MIPEHEPCARFLHPAARAVLALFFLLALLGLLAGAAAIPLLEHGHEEHVHDDPAPGNEPGSSPHEHHGSVAPGQAALPAPPPYPAEPTESTESAQRAQPVPPASSVSVGETAQSGPPEPGTAITDEAHQHAHEDPLNLAGLACGAMALALLFAQFSLSGRLRLLDHIFGLPRLLRFHRVLGTAAACLALAHPLLVFAPAEAVIGPLRLEIWPKLLGMATLASLWSVVLLGLYRALARLPFQQWWLMHRLGVHGLLALAVAHALTVSDAFEAGWPRVALATALASHLALFLWRKAVVPWLLGRRPFVVSEVRAVAVDAHELTFLPRKGRGFAYAPGQFAFMQLSSQAVDAEEHHFTISSAPDENGGLTFTVRCSGDWTGRLGHVAPGDTAILEGPFGLFSHLAWWPGRSKELVFVAGGIGVTPMLGMLRHMRRVADTRKVTLVWINRDEAHVVCAREMRDIEAALPGLTVRHVRTREKESQIHVGYPDEETLRRYLENVSRTARCFVCGPPAMMEAAVWYLRMLGFRSARIHTERFSL